METTSGQATVFNHNISNSNELEQVRRMTGFCPQHNILFDILSVKEHLQVFAGIKGIRKDVVDAEVGDGRCAASFGSFHCHSRSQLHIYWVATNSRSENSLRTLPLPLLNFNSI